MLESEEFGDLTKEEQKNISDLKRGFNIIQETSDYDVLSTRRVEVSRVWAKKLLAASLYLNMCAIIMTTIASVAFMMKPDPVFYATTPAGSLYKLSTVEVNK